MKNILIISTSLRKDSNSEVLADEFAKGANEAGNAVESINLTDKNIGFCRGCLACQKTHKCVIRDDMIELAEKAKNADVLVFATPIYYYGMSGQMKTLLDRCNPIFGSDYRFREIYLLATATDEDESAMDGAVTGLKGWISCFGKAELTKVICGTGVSDSDEMKSHPELCQTAYQAGLKIK